jgi:hypothetical protein
MPAPSAFAHGNQFICARVTIGDDGCIALELTADHGDNPDIADAQVARQVLRECLRIQIDEHVMPLEQLGELRFIDHDRYGPDSPMAASAMAEEGPHRLVTAIWQARLPDQRVVFLAQERTPFDVVMWDGAGAPAPGGGRWMLLIAGDRSPGFVTTPAAIRVPSGVVVALGALAALPFLVWGWRRRSMPAARTV